MSHRVVTAHRRIEDDEASADGLRARCAETASELKDAAAQGRGSAARCRRTWHRRERRKRLAAGLRDVTKAIEKLEPRMLICDRLEHALERLAPWEGLLRGKCDSDGTPLAVTRAVEAARTGVGRDLTELAVTMRKLAERFEAFEPPPKKDPATKDLRTMIAGASKKKTAKGTGGKPGDAPQEIESKTSLRFRDHAE